MRMPCSTYPFNRIIADERRAALLFYCAVVDVLAAVVAAIFWGRGTEVILVGLIVAGSASC